MSEQKRSRGGCGWGIGVLLIGGLAVGGYVWSQRGSGAVSYRVATVETQDVRATVSATGTLEAVTTVEVGTQVSGVIQALLVDFNDEVTEGQVLARIDPTLLQADVDAAGATLSLRSAELQKANAELKRVKALVERAAATQQELEAAQSAAAVSQAQVRAASVALQRAQRNLRYATITAPIQGIVVERAVEVGQTVNAGMSTPRLFRVAGDLKEMQILATVDEADIGQVHEGQAVSFTVQAYPKQAFKGTVQQVRLQSSVVDNVVTYTAVIKVSNEEGKLLPGMTATVDFTVEEAPGMLCVPNAALRFKPPTAEGEGTSGGTSGASGAASGAGGGKPGGGGGGGGGSGGAGGGGGGRGRGGGKGATVQVWTQSGGQLTPISVTLGISNGTCTAATGEGLVEGLEVVTGVQSAESGSGGSNPFQSSSSSRAGRPGGF